jgi:TolB-like protein
MKNIILLIALIAGMSAVLFAQQLTVAVSTFEARGGLSKGDADAITDLFISALVSDGTVKVVNRSSFDTIIAEMKFQASDWTDSDRVIQLGKALKATSIIQGSVMTLAGQSAVTTTILDLNTAQMISSSTLRMKDMSEVFEKMPGFVKDLMGNLPGMEKRSYNIGDKGPGGGFIFYAGGGAYMEVSLTLGSYTWDQAVEAAKNYRGGGFSDWRLPSQSELNMIYQNLRKKNLAGLGDDIYWSSSQVDSYNRIPLLGWQRFSDGQQGRTDANYTYSVRAVRQF